MKINGREKEKKSFKKNQKIKIIETKKIRNKTEMKQLEKFKNKK